MFCSKVSLHGDNCGLVTQNYIVYWINTNKKVKKKKHKQINPHLENKL